jgi:deazaflavin-dependent oxidoreductase (nitroreductase family)
MWHPMTMRGKAMIETIMQKEKQTRQFFKVLNKFMLLMWRLGMGKFMQSPQGGYIMVLTTTGHRSGRQRRAPLNFAQDDDVIYCLPGFSTKTHWYRNLMADPNCEVWLPDGWWKGVAEEITDPEEMFPLLRRLLIRAGFATQLVEGFDPAELSEEELRELGDRYDRVVRIRLTDPCTGPDGPGDLVWIWPIAMAATLFLWAWRSVFKR